MFCLYYFLDDKLIPISDIDQIMALDANILGLIQETLALKGNQLHDAQFKPDTQNMMVTLRVKTDNE